MCNGFGLLVIDRDTVTDRVQIIVRTTAHLSALNQTLDQQQSSGREAM